MSGDDGPAGRPPKRFATTPRLKAWLGSLAISRRDLGRDAVAGVPRAIGSVPDGMAASVLAGVNPVDNFIVRLIVSNGENLEL